MITNSSESSTLPIAFPVCADPWAVRASSTKLRLKIHLSCPTRPVCAARSTIQASFLRLYETHQVMLCSDITSWLGPYYFACMDLAFNSSLIQRHYTHCLSVGKGRYIFHS